ncbi:dachshund c isoform X1 [Corythoichthys intestinalis]|uniref:dachshund c isoform X1 n=1 Tax=Corythoichthys intestinalis TaxID=161448 RepID=UPI0025A63F28|nr:dachshund c isoform X1 [Corythoichthys intestinalis]
MATPAAPALLPVAPLGHHPAASSASPATHSPPPAATSATSSPAPPAARPALLHHFRADLLLANGTQLKTGVGVVPVSGGGNKPVYATPSPVESTPQNNECRLVEVKGAKLASFTVKDTELICLPQAFDVFLKHLVGGLHTVYTKLKRLDITPVVCNVEQVRVLRGLGAIQPGVNRCKLISRQDFETLYSDCTNASSRPGRPPKRLQTVTDGGAHHMLSHGSLMHAGIMPPADLSALAKKIKLEIGGYHSNQQHGCHNGENGDHSPGLVLDQLPFMMMSHPLIPASLAPASVSMAMGQMNRLSTLASIANMAQLHHANPATRPPASVIKERMHDDSPSPSPSLEEAQISSNHSSSVSSSPSHTDRATENTHQHHDGVTLSHCVLAQSEVRELDSMEYGKESIRGRIEKESNPLAGDRQVYQHPLPSRDGCEKAPYPAGQKLPAGLHHAPFIFPEGLSSIETLLTNIQQGLLRVAIENARAQEKQDHLERTELKMELVRERELRETLERQLCMEQKNRVLIQKRLKKEKRSKRRLQEALEEEVKLRDQAEHSFLQHTAGSLSESVTQDADVVKLEDDRVEAKTTMQEGRVFLQTAGMY